MRLLLLFDWVVLLYVESIRFVFLLLLIRFGHIFVTLVYRLRIVKVWVALVLFIASLIEVIERIPSFLFVKSSEHLFIFNWLFKILILFNGLLLNWILLWHLVLFKIATILLIRWIEKSLCRLNFIILIIILLTCILNCEIINRISWLQFCWFSLYLILGLNLLFFYWLLLWKIFTLY